MKKGYGIGIGITALMFLVAVIVWYAPTISSTFQKLFFQSSYTEVKVVMGQIGTYNQGDNTWNFFYRFMPSDSPNSFTVTSGFLQVSYPTIEGTIQTAFGLEIRVSQVTSDYIVLLVKPT